VKLLEFDFFLYYMFNYATSILEYVVSYCGCINEKWLWKDWEESGHDLAWVTLIVLICKNFLGYENVGQPTSGPKN